MASNYIPSAIFFIVIGVLSLQAVGEKKSSQKKRIEVGGTLVFIACSILFFFLVIQQSITVQQGECSFCYAEVIDGLCTRCGSFAS